MTQAKRSIGGNENGKGACGDDDGGAKVRLEDGEPPDHPEAGSDRPEEVGEIHEQLAFAGHHHGQENDDCELGEFGGLNGDRPYFEP